LIAAVLRHLRLGRPLPALRLQSGERGGRELRDDLAGRGVAGPDLAEPLIRADVRVRRAGYIHERRGDLGRTLAGAHGGERLDHAGRGQRGGLTVAGADGVDRVRRGGGGDLGGGVAVRRGGGVGVLIGDLGVLRHIRVLFFGGRFGVGGRVGID